MPDRRKYFKRLDQAVTAVQLALQTKGFTYRKWGATQRCKPRDWLVNNHGEVYTVDRRSFKRTYRQVRAGLYLKTTPVWAEVAQSSGRLRTKEGSSGYRRGDYIVFNDKNGNDGYVVTAKLFKRMYVRAR